MTKLNKNSIKEFLRNFELASGTKDFSKVSNMIHPDALFRFNNGDFRGITDIQAAFESTWSHDIQNDQYQLKNIEIIHIDAQSATVTFNYHWQGITSKGELNIVGRGTQVIVLDNDQLKIRVEHLSR